MGSTAALTNAGLVAVANQSNITGVGTISSGTWQGTAIASTYIAADAITGAKIADDAIDSEHYTDGSIDTAHIADGQVTHGKLADDIVSGQAEITSGFAAADELMYSDGGTIKRVGLDVMATKLFSVASAGTVAQASDHMLFLDGGATGDVIVESIDDFLTAIAGSGISVSSSQLTATTGDMTSVTAGVGLSGGGSSGDVTLALDLSELNTVTPADGDFFSTLDSDGSTEQKTTTTALATLLAGTGLTASSSVIGVDASQTQITSVGTIGTGVWQGTVVAAAYLPDASTSAQGVSELATSAEVTTGTDTGRTVTPDALAGSVVFGTRYVQCVVFDFATDIAEGNGKFYFHIPAGLNGMDLVEVHSEVITAGNGSTIDVQIHNATDGSDMLSTSLTIDNTETGSDTAATAAVIDTGEDDVATNDLIRIDVDGNGGDTTIAKGLIVTLGFRIP